MNNITIRRHCFLRKIKPYKARLRALKPLRALYIWTMNGQSCIAAMNGMNGFSWPAPSGVQLINCYERNHGFPFIAMNGTRNFRLLQPEVSIYCYARNQRFPFIAMNGTRGSVYCHEENHQQLLFLAVNAEFVVMNGAQDLLATMNRTQRLQLWP